MKNFKNVLFELLPEAPDHCETVGHLPEWAEYEEYSGSTPDAFTTYDQEACVCAICGEYLYDRQDLKEQYEAEQGEDGDFDYSLA